MGRQVRGECISESSSSLKTTNSAVTVNNQFRSITVINEFILEKKKKEIAIPATTAH